MKGQNDDEIFKELKDLTDMPEDKLRTIIEGSHLPIQYCAKFEERFKNLPQHEILMVLMRHLALILITFLPVTGDPKSFKLFMNALSEMATQLETDYLGETK